MQLPVINQKALLSLALLIVTFVLYWPVLDDGFIWDAELMHQDSPANSLDNLFAGFVGEAVTASPDNGERTGNLKYYRPFTTALHVVEHQLFGVKPFGYKLTNVALHAVVAILLFFLVMSMLGSIPVAFFSALLFLVKPIHTEAVAWTYSDCYLLLAVFSLSCLLAFRNGKIAVSILAFVLALLTHEMGVLLLPVLYLYLFLVEKRTSSRDLLSLVPYVVLTVAFLGLRRWAVGPVPLTDVEPTVFANTSAFIFAKYLKIFFWPDAPVTAYLAKIFSTPNGYAIAGYILVPISVGCAWMLWRRDRVLLFWFLWFFIWSSVSYNIGRFGAFMMIEKIIYLASAGLGVVLVTLSVRLFANYRYLIYCLLTGIAIVWAVNLTQRLPYWQNSETYLVKALEYDPNFPIGWYALGYRYRQQADYPRALAAFEQVISYDDSFSLAHNNIGNIHYIQGRIPQAVHYWKNAIQKDPSNPQPYFNIGMAMIQMGRGEEALSYYEQYLSHAPQPDPRALRQIEQLRRTLKTPASQ